MLEIYPSADKAKNETFSKGLFLRKPLSDVAFLLALDGVEIGMAELILPPRGNGICSVGIQKEYRKKGYGDFFTRALLLRLSELSTEICVCYASDYYLKFGFRQCGQEMKIESKTLVFPHGCCK